MIRSTLNRLLGVLGILVCFALSAEMRAQTVDPEALDQALEEATTYEFGESRRPLIVIEQHVFAVSDDPQACRELETRLIALLDDSNTLDCRRFACRTLGHIGSAESVPVFRPLLLDSAISEYAVYALEQIDDDRATIELRRGLLNRECPARLRIVGALAARREREAVRDLRSIAASTEESPEIRRASIDALGRIGEQAGMRMLLDLAEMFAPDAEFGREVTRAMIRASESLEFSPTNPAKAQLLRAALARTTEGDNEFIAAMRGLLEINDEVAGQRLVAMLQNGDQDSIEMTVAMLERTTLPYARMGTAEALDRIPEDARPAIIRVISKPGQFRPIPERVREQLQSENEAVRLAAIDALARIGDASDIPALLNRIMSGSESERNAARSTLRSLRDESANGEIVSVLNGTGDSSIKVELIAALGERGAFEQADAVLGAIDDSDMAVRAAAFQALEDIGSVPQIDDLVDRMRSADASSERNLCASAIVAIAQRSNDRDARVQPIVAALGSNEDQRFQKRLLAMCAQLAGRAALDGVRQQVENPALRESAVEAMCNWSDDGPVLDLYRLATNLEAEESIREQALLGYLRQSGVAMSGDPAVAAARLERGWSLCESPQSKKYALSEMSKVPHADVLDIAVSEINDPVVGDVAVNAALEIALRLKKSNRRMALRAVDRILESRSSLDIRQKVGHVVNQIESDEDFITAWVVSAPYSQSGMGPIELFDVEFAPEIVDERDGVAWHPLTITNPDSPGRFDLARTIGGSNRCAYVKTILQADSQVDVRLEFGSDDGIKAWLNGEVVHSNNVLRGLTPGSDVVDVTLKSGKNVLMLKVTQGGGGWGFSCRVRGPLGFHADSVSVADVDDIVSVPSDATILFDGTGLDNWMNVSGNESGWRIVENELIVQPGAGSIMTKDEFHDFVLHLEFMIPADTQGSGQGRGNSGVYLLRRYEVQILESFGLDPSPTDCGGIYGRVAPRINASRAPGEWQRYLIDFTAPKWTGDGQKVENARLTIWHNGHLIHDDVEVEGKTGAGQTERSAPGPILLQDHGSRIHFRNIWIRPKRPTWEGENAPGFKPLFDGETLNGWVQRGGEAEYRAENGEIIGATRPNQPNSFLCTEETFSDFVLELQFKVDPELNSGIQIRSNSTPDYQNGRVHGYQVEIDPSDRAWSAGIYDEARRGWLASLDENPRAQRAFRQNAWNRLRIEAIGDEFRTYINGVPAAHLIDDMTAEGFIGLQVHGVGGREDPLEVRWRDLRIREIR